MLSKKRGFTLLEVLIVVIIIGILAGIALPQYMSTLEKARSAEAMTNLGTLRSAMERHWLDQLATQNTVPVNLGVGSAGVTPLDVDNPNEDSDRLWDYTISDNCTIVGTANKDYYIAAIRRTDGKYWLKIDEAGTITKSDALGGGGGGEGEY